jgi:hypothetical protein
MLMRKSSRAVVEPLAGRLRRHGERLAQGGNDVVAQEVHRVALALPGAAIGRGKRGLEGLERALGDEVALHVGNVRGVAREAQFFIEDAKEDLQDGVAVVLAVGLGVDVEQDHIGRALHGAVDVGQQHGVLDLFVVKELGCVAFLPGGRIGRLDVLQQVGQDLDEVRLAGAEETRHPDAHAVGDGGVMWAVHGGQVGVEELAQVLADLLGDDVLFQLLPDAGGVHLVGLDDAVDGAVDRLEEQLADFHILVASVWTTGFGK